jgi:ABC-2 type transport system permease protein
MRTAWDIARKDLLLRVRDRSVLVIGVIAPLVLAFIFNLVFGDTLTGDRGAIEFDYGVHDADEGQVGQAFVVLLDEIGTDHAITIEHFLSENEARDSVETGEIDALFVVPAGVTNGFAQGEPTEIEVVGNVDSSTATGVATAIAEGFSTQLATSTVAAVAAAEGGAIDPAQIPATVAEAAGQSPAAIVLDVSAETRQLDTATYFVAGLSIFFLFFVAGLGVTSMLEERRDGTMARLIAAPVGRSSILGGKALMSFVIGLGAMATLVIASTLLMGADWGPPLGVAMLTVAAVAAVVALMSLVGGLARTPEQASNLQAIVGVTFGMLGGSFVPIADSESLIGRLQSLTPNAWFLRGLGDISTGEITAAVLPVAVLAGMAVVGGVAATFIARKVVTV